MKRNRFYLVIGVFFHEKSLPAFGFGTMVPDTTLMKNVIEHTMFSGVIDTFNKVGALQDRLGDSELEAVEVQNTGDSTKISFIKKYNPRSPEITYELQNCDGSEPVLTGEWKTENGLSGKARMWFIETANEKLSARSVYQTLGFEISSITGENPPSNQMDDIDDDLPF